jgi:biopolymer transport protein ExbD
VTLKVEDIMGQLDVTRAAPDPNAVPEDDVNDLIEITIYRPRDPGDHGYKWKDTVTTLDAIKGQLRQLASISKDIPIVVKCTEESPHFKLVDLLEVCSELGLKKLCLFSM